MIRCQEVYAEAAQSLAIEFQNSESNSETSLSGISPKAAKIFHLSTWLHSAPRFGRGFCFSLKHEPALILWSEPDRFNSEVLSIPQARAFWLLNPRIRYDVKNIVALGGEITALLRTLPWRLIALRVLGHHPVAFELFQTAGFHLIIDNAWFYRLPDKSLQVKWPLQVDFEWQDLKQAPLTKDRMETYLEIAQESFFDDRFSLDYHIDVEKAKQRFLAIIENALTGKIADYVVTARIHSQVKAFMFFGVEANPSTENSLPIAGTWFTAIGGRHAHSKGLCVYCIVHAIKNLPLGEVNWICTCALNNFPSLNIAMRLGFKLGAIAYDFHWWRNVAESK